MCGAPKPPSDTQVRYTTVFTPTIGLTQPHRIRLVINCIPLNTQYGAQTILSLHHAMGLKQPSGVTHTWLLITTITHNMV